VLRIKDASVFCLQSILLTPLRSILTVLGLAIGVGSILTVLSLGSAGQAQVEKEILRLGVDKIWITAAHRSRRTLTASDAQSISLATGADASGRSYALLPVSANDNTIYSQVSGCDEHMSAVHQTTLLSGRFLCPMDHLGALSSAVIDLSLCTALDLEPSKAVGQSIRIGGRRFGIVGVIADQSTQTFGGAQGCAYIPMEVFAAFISDRVDEITLRIPPQQPAQALADRAVTALPREGDYEAVTLQEEIDAARSVIRIFVMVLASVAAVCMLTGGIGVMNILLVSVRERRREIGVIKALGGTRRQVCSLFLAEAVAYSLSGGAAGLLLGLILNAVTASWIGLNSALDGALILPALLSALAVGVTFGVFPALRAASMTPVDALRQE